MGNPRSPQVEQFRRPRKRWQRQGSRLPRPRAEFPVRLLGIKGTLIVGGLAAGAFFLLPSGLKEQLLGAVAGGSAQSTPASGSSVCQAVGSERHRPATSRAWFWRPRRTSGRRFSRAKPAAAATARRSRELFAPDAGRVRERGLHRRLRSTPPPTWDPSTARGQEALHRSELLRCDGVERLRAPGDFAQAYVIAPRGRSPRAEPARLESS